MAAPPKVLWEPDGLETLIREERAELYAISIAGMIALRPPSGP